MGERKRRTIPPDAMDPLAAVLPTEAPSADSPPPAGQKATRPTTIKKEQLAIRVSESLAEEIRNCVVFLAGHPLHLTLSKLGEEALREKIEQLKVDYNNGESFPERQEDLKVGRPIR